MSFIILNRKYNIFNVKYIQSEKSYEFFKECFTQSIESKENPEKLLEIFKNNMFMLNENERMNYTMDYIVYMNLLKKCTKQILINFDYHLNVPNDRQTEWKAFLYKNILD